MTVRAILSVSLFALALPMAARAEGACEGLDWIETSPAQVAHAVAERSQRIAAIRLFAAAQRAAASGDVEKVASALKDIIDAEAPVLPGPQSPIAAYADDPKVAPLLGAMRGRICPTANGTLLVDLPDAGIAAEGIAWDPVTRRLFLSDWQSNAIVMLTLDGFPETYFRLPSLTPNGIAIDATRRILWFVATDAFRDGAAEPRSVLWRIDLATGAARAIPAFGRAGFNDLAIAPDGSVYLSDTRGGRIWTSAPEGDILRAVTSEANALNSPNGLAIDGTGQYLYVGQGLDPVRVSLSNGEIEAIELPPGVETAGTDGLYWREGHLLTIQNFVTPGTVIEFDLADDGLGVERYRVLERANPAFDLPTTGTFIGDRFAILAATGLYSFGAGKKPAAGQARALRIIAYGL